MCASLEGVEEVEEEEDVEVEEVDEENDDIGDALVPKDESLDVAAVAPAFRIPGADALLRAAQ